MRFTFSHLKRDPDTEIELHLPIKKRLVTLGEKRKLHTAHVIDVLIVEHPNIKDTVCLAFPITIVLR